MFVGTNAKLLCVFNAVYSQLASIDGKMVQRVSEATKEVEAERKARHDAEHELVHCRAVIFRQQADMDKLVKAAAERDAMLSELRAEGESYTIMLTKLCRLIK